MLEKTFARIPIPKKFRTFFPKCMKSFIFVTDIGEIETYVSATGPKNVDPGIRGDWIDFGIRPWFDRHQDLEAGDTLIIDEIENKRKYKLEILKGPPRKRLRRRPKKKPKRQSARKPKDYGVFEL